MLAYIRGSTIIIVIIIDRFLEDIHMSISIINEAMGTDLNIIIIGLINCLKCIDLREISENITPTIVAIKKPIIILDRVKNIDVQNSNSKMSWNSCLNTSIGDANNIDSFISILKHCHRAIQKRITHIGILSLVLLNASI